MDRINRGHTISHLPPSFTVLEMINFIPAFAPEKEEVVSNIHGGVGGGDAELRSKMQLVQSERGAENL